VSNSIDNSFLGISPKPTEELEQGPKSVQDENQQQSEGDVSAKTDLQQAAKPPLAPAPQTLVRQVAQNRHFITGNRGRWLRELSKHLTTSGTRSHGAESVLSTPQPSIGAQRSNSPSISETLAGISSKLDDLSTAIGKGAKSSTYVAPVSPPNLTNPPQDPVRHRLSHPRPASPASISKVANSNGPGPTLESGIDTLKQKTGGVDK
jgi:hypothetical protein